MGEKVILLDTNVVSDGLKPTPNVRVEAWLDANESAPLWISAITIAELRAGVEMKSDGRNKERLHRAVDRAIDHFGGLCVSFDALAAEQYARVVAARRKLGDQLVSWTRRLPRLRLAPDARSPHSIQNTSTTSTT